MKKKNNVNDIFGTALDYDVALNNPITVQAKFKLCSEQDIILNKIMEHLTHCRFVYFNLFVYPHKMKKFIDENALVVKKEIINKETKVKENVDKQETFKVLFCRIYQISSRQFNSIDFFVKGMIKSNKTLMNNHLVNFKDQLKSKSSRLKKLNGEINLLEKAMLLK